MAETVRRLQENRTTVVTRRDLLSFFRVQDDAYEKMEQQFYKPFISSEEYSVYQKHLEDHLSRGMTVVCRRAVPSAPAVHHIDLDVAMPSHRGHFQSILGFSDAF